MGHARCPIGPWPRLVPDLADTERPTPDVESGAETVFREPLLRPGPKGPWRLFLCLHVLCIGPPVAPLAAQDADSACPDGRISYIFIDNHSIFDPNELGEERSFQWAYELVNALHMDTRASFLSDEILVSVGDCYDPFLIDESGRLLRSYSFIADADVFGIQQDDGTWHVVVDTADEWTTEFNVHFNFEEGVEFRGVDLTEESFLGRGILLGAFLEQNDELRDIGGRVGTPRLLGTRIDALLSAGSTRVGSFFEQRLVYPFVGEIGRYAGSQTFRRREDRFTYWAGEGQEFSHVLLPLDEEALELSLAKRFGEPGDLTTVGLSFERRTLEFPGYPGAVVVGFDGNFGESEPAGDDLAERLRGQTRFTAATRLSLLLGRRRVEFVRRQGLDALTGVQDVPLGTDLSLSLGRSIGFLAPSDDTPEDLQSRASFFHGSETGPFLFTVRAGLDARHVLSGGVAGKGWRDVTAQLYGLAYWQRPAWPTHTFVGRLAASGSSRSTLPYQLTLGGSNGLRGYPERSYPGGRRLVMSLEDRLYVGWPAPQLFDLGFTFFGDVGRMWASGIPFGEDSGWRGSVGGGLRLGFPAGTRGVIRLDLAFPLDRERAGNPILRLALFEVVGLNRLGSGS